MNHTAGSPTAGTSSSSRGKRKLLNLLAPSCALLPLLPLLFATGPARAQDAAVEVPAADAPAADVPAAEAAAAAGPVVTATVTPAAAAGPDGDLPFPQPEESAPLTALSLEDLMNVEIYSVSKHSQRLAQAPAAVSVIGQEDIRRSGMNSIPELLRLAPGLNVAQINASQWAISSRGFNDLYANKLLVLMDGRSVYTPLFSGVYWDTLDYILPDLDRVEVIRGPGATLWGANAVNGVINITSKTARDTQGWLATARASNVDQVGGLRYGGRIDDQTFYRVYGKYRTTDNFETADGEGAHDGWDALRGGFRIDRYPSDRDTLTLQGDAYTHRVGSTLLIPSLAPPFTDRREVTNQYSGGNFLARWTHVLSPTSDFSVQFYYDRLERGDAQAQYTLDTVDLEFQHRFALTDRQEVIYGGDLRFLSDSIKDGPVGTFRPRERDDYLVSAFVQDDVTLVPDRLHLILGTKLEQNSYSGFEVQPSRRVLWTPNERNTVWGAVSHAVRTPSRWEQDSRLLFSTMPTPAGLPARVQTIGNDDFESERLTAYELGYRVQATPSLSFDTSVFFNSYDKLRSGRAGAPAFQPAPAPHLVVPVALGNEIDGETYGAEVAATWAVAPTWRLVGSYTWLNVQLHRDAGVDPTLERIFERTSPRNQFQLRSYLDLTDTLELNAALFYVDNVRSGDVPAYVRVDAGLAWRPTDGLELGVGVQNIFDDRHAEFDNGLFFNSTNEVPRTYYGQLTYRF